MTMEISRLRIGRDEMDNCKYFGRLFASHQWLTLMLILALLPAFACGRYEARQELNRSEYFAQILRRVDRRSMGEDRFFEENLLGNPDSEVRQWCAIALGRIASQRGLPLLYRAIHTGDAAVRAASAFAIGQIENRAFLAQRNLPPDPDAAKELLSLLHDSSLAVQMRAIEALGKIGSHAGAAEIASRLDHFSYSGSPLEQAYLGLAVTALARLRDPIALPSLTRLASTGDAESRKRASEAISILNGPATDLVSPSAAGQQNSDTSAVPDAGIGGESRAATSAVTNLVSRTLAASRRNSTIAVLETTRGIMEILLFREDAPLTVANFVLTANRGNYQGFVFDQVLPSRLIEGTIAGTQTEYGSLRDGEINMRPFERGSIGISFIDGPSANGRFFIALAPQPYFDGTDTCFGRVISGMQVADRIIPGDKILRIRIKETIGFMDRIQY